MSTQTVPLIIDGRDIVDHEATVFVSNPGGFLEKKWRAQGATTEHCQRAVESAAAAWKTWRTSSADERAALFCKLAEILEAGKGDLIEIIKEEISSSQLWAEIIVQDTIGLARNKAYLIGSGALSTGVAPTMQTKGAVGIVSQRPLGVVLGMAPWNAPAILGLRAVAAAVAAGNCCIFKGSEFSPRTHYYIAKAFRDAGFPAGVVNFLVHRPEDAPSVFEALISHPAVRKCNFTGSTAVGRHIAERAAHYLKPVLLELGGKNYVLVLEDADLETAAEQILFGALLNNGQICMSTDVVLVPAQKKAALCQLLKQKLDAVAKAHAKNVINERSRDKIAALVEDATSKGSTLLRCDPAVVICDLAPGMEFWHQESFGPVVGVATYNTVAEAVDIINEGEYGLSAAIFTRTAGPAAVELAGQLSVGAVHVNGPTVHDEAGLPHGGHKNSGWGRFGGVWGLQEFVQTQTVILNP